MRFGLTAYSGTKQKMREIFEVERAKGMNLPGGDGQGRFKFLGKQKPGR